MAEPWRRMKRPPRRQSVFGPEPVESAAEKVLGPGSDPVAITIATCSAFPLAIGIGGRDPRRGRGCRNPDLSEFVSFERALFSTRLAGRWGARDALPVLASGRTARMRASELAGTPRLRGRRDPGSWPRPRFSPTALLVGMKLSTLLKNSAISVRGPDAQSNRASQRAARKRQGIRHERSRPRDRQPHCRGRDRDE